MAAINDNTINITISGSSSDVRTVTVVNPAAKSDVTINTNRTKTVSSLSNHTTDNLSEGTTNLYFTDARADARADYRIGETKINALLDVNVGTTPPDNVVLSYDSATKKWINDGRLTTLYNQFRSGSDTNIYADGTTTTEGKLLLSDTGADLKVNITGLEITESSPGDIEFVVATDANGDTAFTAIHIDGSTTANQADFLVKNGTSLKLDDGTYTQQLRPSSGNTANTVVVMPSKNGTIAVTGDLYTDSDADARIAAASIDDLSDVDTSTVAPTDGQALVWDNTASKWEPGDAGGSAWTTSGDDIYYTTGNVGIGTTSPAEALDVSGQADIKDSNNNVLISTGNSTITASNTVAVGYQALTSLTTGAYNTAVGYQALNSAQTAQKNVAVGYQAGDAITTGSNNTVMGYQAGNAITTGIANTLMGDSAGTAITTGANNILIGYSAGSGITSQGKNIAIGKNSNGTSNSSGNVAIGNEAIGNGGSGVAIGENAGRFEMTEGAFVGYNSGYLAGDYSVGLGWTAGAYARGDYNVSIGHSAGKGVAYTSNFSNTVAVGYQALTALTTGTNNTAVGYQASKALTTSIETTNIGYQAGLSGSSGASYNTYIGYKAGTNGSSAQSNTMVGRMAGTTNSTGDNNTAVGTNAALYLLSGGGNVAIGTTAMYANSTGSDNVMIGNQSGRNATGSSNVFIGHDSGYNETGSNKLYIENSDSATPLIYGEFDNDIVKINGDLEVTSKIVSSSNGDIDIEPNGTGDVLLGNFKFDADQTVGASQDDYVLTYDNTSGKISLEAAAGGGGGILNIANISGQFTVGTADDAGEDNIVAGGFRGANYYLWNNDVFTTANSVATGIGTPGTSTFSSGKGYDIMNGLFYVPQAGTAKLSIGIEFDNNAEVAGETWRFFMWKIGSDEITAIESGTYDSAWAGTLVASLTLTVPSSVQNIVPIHKQSSNGSSISEGDYVFVTGVFDGTVTSTRNFPCNVVMYST